MKIEELADQINNAHKRLILGLRRVYVDGVQIGQWLIEAKQKMPYGQWEKWADAHLICKKRMRCYYMESARNPEKGKKINDINGLSHLVVEINKAAATEERKELIADAVANLLPTENNWQVHQSDNRVFNWPEFDLLYGDPPWQKREYYIWLAELADKKLREGGCLLIQCAQTDFAKVIPIFKDYMTTLSIIYNQASNKLFNCFMPNWKPVLLFSKGKTVFGGPVSDAITTRETKVYHEWQQPLEPWLKWLPALTKPGDLVADPFTCTGTMPVACKKTGRKCIATEVNPDMVAVARKRLAEVTKHIKCA